MTRNCTHAYRSRRLTPQGQHHKFIAASSARNLPRDTYLGLCYAEGNSFVTHIHIDYNTYLADLHVHEIQAVLMIVVTIISADQPCVSPQRQGKKTRGELQINISSLRVFPCPSPSPPASKSMHWELESIDRWIRGCRGSSSWMGY